MGAGARRLVVVISKPHDRHARAVLMELQRRRAPALRVDVAGFPERLGLDLALGGGGTGWSGRLRTPSGGALETAAVGAVWWRRAHPFSLHRSIGEEQWGGVYCACDSAMGAFWRSLRALRVNEPAVEEAADVKPEQLALASRLGLTVPRSCITNDPAAARAFIRERPVGETIHKNVTSALVLDRATRVARATDRPLLASVRHRPLLFQERVPAAADVRVTVVGGDLFAAEIDFPRGGSPVDWRSARHRARFRAVTLPHLLESRLRHLVRALGLVYAAIDLRRRPDGEHVFLEVNPSGQWLFVEERTQQPITAALATVLARGHPR